MFWICQPPLQWASCLHEIVVGRGQLLHGPKSGLLSNTWKRIMQGDTGWQSKRLWWKRVPGWRAAWWGNSGEPLWCVACRLGFYVDGISFWVVFGQLFWLRVLPGGTHITQPRWMLVRGILGGRRTHGVSFWPLPNSFSWWWLISSIFLTRTSCHKTTHANFYYGAWPGWVVSVSVLTKSLLIIYIYICRI